MNTTLNESTEISDRRSLLSRAEYFPLAEARSVAGDLCRLRERIAKLGFSERAIAETLGVAVPHEAGPGWPAVWNRYHLDGSLPVHTLIRLFVLNLPEQRRVVEELFSSAEVELLERFGLLVLEDDQAVRAPVALCPIGPLLVVTDWAREPKARDAEFGSRVMCLGGDSYGLARLVATTAGESALDLCSGSGVIGLMAARRYRRVTGIDINPRAVNFATFNALLNGIDNCTFVRADLYEAVGDHRFDLIAANPPFVPTPHVELLYRDGGRGGEEVLSRIVAGCLRHLTPQGRCLIISDLVEHRRIDYLAKVRAWLGGSDGFHAVVLRWPAADPCQYALDHAAHRDSATVLQWIEQYRAEGITGISFGYLAVQSVPNAPTHIVSLPLTDVVARDSVPDGFVAGMFERMAMLRGPEARELTFRPSFTARRVDLVPAHSPLKGYRLPYPVVRCLMRKDAPEVTLAGMEADLAGAGLEMNARQRAELASSVEGLFIAGYLNLGACMPSTLRSEATDLPA